MAQRDGSSAKEERSWKDIPGICAPYPACGHGCEPAYKGDSYLPRTVHMFALHTTVYYPRSQTPQLEYRQRARSTAASIPCDEYSVLLRLSESNSNTEEIAPVCSMEDHSKRHTVRSLYTMSTSGYQLQQRGHLFAHYLLPRCSIHFAVLDKIPPAVYIYFQGEGCSIARDDSDSLDRRGSEQHLTYGLLRTFFAVP